ncbi:MAG TPA: sigma-70 family RNA polymerase sigma factor [Gemmataceae bacterium]|jgi:RNA polymerase sigma-70 factor (ECF subfamily)|nr:sigma-70 family RNA polymerase sigma factor [Gemmataceae bacterium]
MGPAQSGNSSETERLLQGVAAGNREIWGDLLARHRERLRLMVSLRLNPRLKGRIDPSDVVQEAFLTASVQLDDYLKKRSLPFFLWLRAITGQKLIAMHRHHLGKKMRDAGREVPLYAGALPGTSSAALAAQLLGHELRPSQAAMRAELEGRVREVLDSMESLDREVLVLRHFEQLSNAETAQVLGLQENTASKRYIRALRRLKALFIEMPGGIQGLLP